VVLHDLDLMKCAPTSDRIAEDIMKIVPVLDKIIEAKGGVVPDEYHRTGRRWRRVDDKGDCTLSWKPGVRLGSARPRWSPGLTSWSSRRPTRPLWTRLLLARASRGGGDAGVRCGSAEAKVRFLFS
jgi:hypothetical protein